MVKKWAYLILIILHNEIIYKGVTVTKYEERPDSFAYFDNCYHVFDMKVKH